MPGVRDGVREADDGRSKTMRMLPLEVLDEMGGRPRGNPFHVRTVMDQVIQFHSHNYIPTGIKIDIPVDLEMRATAIISQPRSTNFR